MLRSFNSFLAAICAVALGLIVAACAAPPSEDAAEDIVYENAVEENFDAADIVSDNEAGSAAGNTDDAAVIDDALATDGGPSDEAEEGFGAFKELGDMEVDNWYVVEFFVAPDEAGLADESQGADLTAPAAIYVAPAMRVTLQPDPNFEIRAKSAAVVMTGRDRDASWQWDVRPLTGGARTLYATVEVLQRNPDGSLKRNSDGSLVVSEPKTRRVDVRVKVGTWKALMKALGNASSLGDALATLFAAWEKTLIALAALIAAAGGVWLAIRKLRQPG